MLRPSSPRRAIALLTIAVLVGGAGCEREHRTLHASPAEAAPPRGVAGTQIPDNARGAMATVRAKHDEGNSYAISQGKLLFGAYNCIGCHAQGGGGRGPALMDADWIYGAEPESVFMSIVGGRPNGMPAFGNRIPEYQVWQLVAYVRSMTGLVDPNAAPGRNDAIQAKPSEQLADEQPPRHAGSSVDSETPK